MKLTSEKLQQIIKEELNNFLMEAVLRRGSRGPEVEQLQQQLKDMGFGSHLGTSGPNKDGVDGKFGGGTKKAVEAFQEDQGFTGRDVDGIVGQNTAKAIRGGVGTVGGGAQGAKRYLAQSPSERATERRVGKAGAQIGGMTPDQVKRHYAMRAKARAGEAEAKPEAEGEPEAEDGQEEKSDVGASLINRLWSSVSSTVGTNLISSMFGQFVLRRKAPFTAADVLSSDGGEEIMKTLGEICCWASKNIRGARSGKRVMFGDDLHYEKMATAGHGEYAGGMRTQMGGLGDAFKNVDPLHNIRNTLTHFSIQKIGKNTYRLEDNYDFNPAVNILPADEAGGRAVTDPKFFTSWRNFAKFLSGGATGQLKIYMGRGEWKSIDFFSKSSIENLSRFYHGLFNYKGYSVNIVVEAKCPSSQRK